jgi:hypothetical protein
MINKIIMFIIIVTILQSAGRRVGDLGSMT